MTLDQVIDTLSYEDLAALKNMIESGHGNDAIAVLEDFGWDGSEDNQDAVVKVLRRG